VPNLRMIHQSFQLFLLVCREEHGLSRGRIAAEKYARFGSGIDGFGEDIPETVESLGDFDPHILIQPVFDILDCADDVHNIPPHGIEAICDFVGVDMGISIDGDFAVDKVSKLDADVNHPGDID